MRRNLKLPLAVSLILRSELTSGLHVVTEPVPLVTVILLVLRQGLTLEANTESLQNTTSECVEEGNSGNIGREFSEEGEERISLNIVQEALHAQTDGDGGLQVTSGVPDPGGGESGISVVEDVLPGLQVRVVEVSGAVLDGRELVGQGREEVGHGGGLRREPLEQLLTLNFDEQVVGGSGVPSDSGVGTAHEETKGEREDGHAIEELPAVQLQLFDQDGVVQHQVVIVTQNSVASSSHVFNVVVERGRKVLTLEARGDTVDRVLKVVVDDGLVSIVLIEIREGPFLSSNRVSEHSLDNYGKAVVLRYVLEFLRSVVLPLNNGWGSGHAWEGSGCKLRVVGLVVVSVVATVVETRLLVAEATKKVVVGKQYVRREVRGARPSHSNEDHDEGKEDS